ncbi:hypothetical protein [Halodesulfovibrio sp.]|jgi:hypothetical protein|uniref:hypothetical protein n=1 Tax=Halodesulfovibrio sp. TaxID=1912772 RepID=UPI0025EAD0CE|nr:hypothetical protein [Halodesulfovibrio sp.]MCT4627942.1 hypothetical protein [Halodesulfovibrio sp.]
MSQRFLLNINNRRVVSYNPILATRKDMVECDANGQLIDPVVAASMATSSSAQSVGLTPDPVPHQAVLQQAVNPVAAQLNAEDARREYCMTKGLSSLNRDELKDIALFFSIAVIDDDTKDEIKVKIEEARALV